MSELATVEEEQTERKGLMFFGVDLMKIECLRGSLLNGYIGAAVGGLGGFMYKSNTKFACHTAFGSYWAVAFASWILCRYEKYQRDKHWEHMKQAVNERQNQEGEYYLPPQLVKKEVTKVEELTKES